MESKKPKTSWIQIFLIIFLIIVLIVGIALAIYFGTKSDEQKDVDCVVGDWEEWGECDKECGGVQKRIRQIVTKHKGTGAVCPSLLMQKKPCNFQNCAKVSSDENYPVADVADVADVPTLSTDAVTDEPTLSTETVTQQVPVRALKDGDITEHNVNNTYCQVEWEKIWSPCSRPCGEEGGVGGVRTLGAKRVTKKSKKGLSKQEVALYSSYVCKQPIKKMACNYAPCPASTVGSGFKNAECVLYKDDNFTGQPTTLSKGSKKRLLYTVSKNGQPTWYYKSMTANKNTMIGIVGDIGNLRLNGVYIDHQANIADFDKYFNELHPDLGERFKLGNANVKLYIANLDASSKISTDYPVEYVTNVGNVVEL